MKKIRFHHNGITFYTDGDNGMNKERYHELLRLRLVEETLIHSTIEITQLTPREVYSEALEGLIPRKRFLYILAKWAKQGRYEYTEALDIGWLTD